MTDTVHDDEVFDPTPGEAVLDQAKQIIVKKKPKPKKTGQKGKRLTDQQKIFVEEYLTSWNATEAYQRAHPKCTRRTARQNGSRALTNANISAAVNKRLQEKAMGADEALARLANMARTDMSDYIDIVDGKTTLNLAKAKEDGKLYLIKSLAPTAHGLKVELYDAQTALGQIVKYHQGIGPTKIDLSGSVEITEDIEKVRQRRWDAIKPQVVEMMKQMNVDSVKP